MRKKYIFADIDGTIVDHSINGVPESTRRAIKSLQDNGHEVILTTGRCPSLFKGIDEDLNLDSYIASNGRYVVHKNEVIYNNYMNKKVVADLVDLAYKDKIDVAFSSSEKFVLNSRFTDLPDKFTDTFHLDRAKVHRNYHLESDIYQINLFYNEPDYEKYVKLFPTLNFNFSNLYGFDVNEVGGLKELGIKMFQEKLGVDIEDTIAIGDGNNDVSMIQYANIGIAMGNGVKPLKDAADIVTDDISKDGFYNVFKKLNLI